MIEEIPFKNHPQLNGVLWGILILVVSFVLSMLLP